MQFYPDSGTAEGAAQLAIADEVYQNLLLAQYGWCGGIAGVANAFAESSLIPVIAGDEQTAGGLFQLHVTRYLDIKKGCGSDMWNGSVVAQVGGVVWEMRKYAYLGLAQIKAATTPEDAAEAWCRYYERPAAVAADVAERRTYATWFKARWPQPTQVGPTS